MLEVAEIRYPMASRFLQEIEKGLSREVDHSCTQSIHRSGQMPIAFPFYYSRYESQRLRDSVTENKPLPERCVTSNPIETTNSTVLFIGSRAY